MQGHKHLENFLTFSQQHQLLAELKPLLREAPFYTPTMPKSGQPFSVLETNLGPLGWVSDKKGYRYQDSHPFNNQPWPPIPESLLQIWRAVSAYPLRPQAALLNLYSARARMGLHQDKDEAAEDAPVVSISIGASARFRFGGLKRQDPAKTFRLNSGDVFIFGGPSRFCYHGIDRILKTAPKGHEDEVNTLSEQLMGLINPAITTEAPLRLNITMRRVTHPI
jgi:alkylated DNA repair protein (DNA oxidative demethylase)